MITETTFKQLLHALNFTAQSNKKFSKIFANGTNLAVDFENKKLIYPNGLKINEQQTCNFSASENFVVFECVHRLLEKGYAPESIELEPKWKLGRGASGGRADILVKNLQNNPLLIVECKTAGKEFDKAWKATEFDGDQLFSYAQQIPATQFLCLYTSDFTTELTYISHIIPHRDNEKILADDNNLKSFKDAQSVKERYAVWRDTYKLEFTRQGIFENNIATYTIGKDKYQLDDLNQIDGRDKEGKYHQFRTILRKHNVARRENAFEVLVNLFLCKIVDETEHPRDLHFYWKGIAYDSYFELVDRLQSLYKIGMERFLNQDIIYISNDEIDNAFWAFKNDKNATKQTIKKLFTQLKFYKGLDFDFIKVHNKELFEKNAKVLIEIVQMWQDSRLKTHEQNQFLGDMFEYFLDNGIKQSEGQFFTPMPICRFILMSLPLENLIKESEYPPHVIDYACGAGHFLNEYAAQIRPFVSQHKDSTPLNDFYKEIVGIEKEDRLAKVAKVSAFMYGQDEIQIIDADALANHKNIKPDSFNVLVANPPFAVEGFLETLDEKDRENYELLKTVSDVMNNRNVQCFFIERAVQLLAPHGMAAIIVPSSVLSNSDATHVGSREILLKHFDIIALVELGSGTFGKTGTHTVVLFLRRKHKQPTEAEQYLNRVNDWFDNWQEELNCEGGAYKDIHFVRNYCQHIGISFDHYQTLLNGKPSAELLSLEMFVDYRKDFDNSSDITKLKTQKFFKDFTLEQKQIELEKRFLTYLRAIEKDKLFYFALASENLQKVLIIKSPSDNKEQKAFLGYEWSAAKGNEGIKLTTDSNGNHVTPLYDLTSRNNPEKINALITQNFLGQLTDIPEVLQPFASLTNLVDMLDFSRKDFDKTISLMDKKAFVEIESRWDLMKLENLMTIVRGASPRPIDKFLTNDLSGINWIKIGDVKEGDKYITQTAEKITLEGAEKSRFVKEGDFILSNSMSSGRPYILKISGCIHDGWLLLSQFDNRLTPDYFYYLLSHYDGAKQQLSDNALGGIVKNLNIDRVKNIKIPLPPLEIQQQIVSECEAVDLEVETAQSSIEQTLSEISNKIQAVFKEGKETKISNLHTLLKRGKSTKYGGSTVQVIKSGQARGYTEFDFFERHFAIDTFQSDERNLQKGDLLINSTGVGTAGRVTLFELDGHFVADGHITIFRPNSEILSRYALYCLAHIGFKNIEKMAKGSTGQIELTLQTIEEIKLPLISLENQQTLVTQIETFEKQIDDAQKVIDGAVSRKTAVLSKFL